MKLRRVICHNCIVPMGRAVVNSDARDAWLIGVQRCGQLDGGQYPLDLGGELHKDELAAVVEVVFAAFVLHAN